MHVIAAKAVAFKEALAPGFTVYQQRILDNARALADGFIARGYHVVSGGTDTHLFLLNLNSRGVTGKEAEEALDASGIIVNKNAVPYDERPPAVASGIRIGTPIASTRGMGVSRDVANRGVDGRGVAPSHGQASPEPDSQGSQGAVRPFPGLFGLVIRFFHFRACPEHSEGTNGESVNLSGGETASRSLGTRGGVPDPA